MTDLSMTAAPPKSAAGSAWAALAERRLLIASRDGTLLGALITPLLFFLCFYTPLRNTVSAADGGYAQYILPLVLLQAMMLAAIVTAGVAAEEAASGMVRRLHSLPIPLWTPVAARITTSFVVIVISLFGASAAATIFGFRLHGDAIHTLLFAVLAVIFGLALCLGADTLGTRTAAADKTQQLLSLPQMLFVMLSTGLVPAARFPEWIRGFVEHQPISVLAGALRALAAGQYPSASAWIWAISLAVVFAITATIAQGRRS